VAHRVALSLCAGSLNVLAQHGCTTKQAGLDEHAQAVLVGGRNALLKRALLLEFSEKEIWAIDAIDHGAINGDDQTNIANRTPTGLAGNDPPAPFRVVRPQASPRRSRQAASASRTAT